MNGMLRNVIEQKAEIEERFCLFKNTMKNKKESLENRLLLEEFLKSTGVQTEAIEQEVNNFEDCQVRKKEKADYIKNKAKNVLKSDEHYKNIESIEAKTISHLVNSMDLIYKFEEDDETSKLQGLIAINITFIF